MQTVPERSELVRCLACREVYEQTDTPSRGEPGAACPHCGDLGWLDVRVPVEGTGPPLSA
jgi:rRNA maturation endonuclease Nob1